MADQNKKKMPKIPKFNEAPMQIEQTNERIIDKTQTNAPQQQTNDISTINNKLSNILKHCKTKLPQVVNKPQEYDPSRPNDYEELKKQEQQILKEQQAQVIEEEENQQQQDFEVLGVGEEKALKMMEKFGYKFGTGLGKYNQGIVTPLIVKKTASMSGVIEQSQFDFTDLLPQNVVYKRAFEQHKQSPTPILVLINMVTAKEVDNELEQEIKEELSKYGKIKKCHIHLRTDLEEDLQVRVFVQFETTEQAMNAFFGVDQRVFGVRVVVCRFYEEDKFNDGLYDLEL